MPTASVVAPANAAVRRRKSLNMRKTFLRKGAPLRRWRQRHPDEQPYSEPLAASATAAKTGAITSHKTNLPAPP
jgi:hypothetical protein